MNIVLVGPPGAGKGTQSSKIIENYSCRHISTGDLIRHHIADQTELGAQLLPFVNRGQLAPQELVDGIVAHTVKLYSDQHPHHFSLLFDGYPRNLSQALFLDELMHSFQQKVHYAINLHIPDDVLETRIVYRRICEACHRTFNLLINPPSVSGSCDVCGARLVQRQDDTIEIVRDRLKVFHKQTNPVIDHYRDAKVLFNVDASRPVDVVFREIQDIIK